MLGGYFAGSESCDGDWQYEYKMKSGAWQPIDPQYSDVEKRKTKFTYYGMSTHLAQEKFEDSQKKYRASEGTKITIPFKGSTDKVIQELLGGIRSCCCYIGSDCMKHMSRCGQFCRVNQIHSNKAPILGI
jgi:IMP dehydrogenase/GMP reductase